MVNNQSYGKLLNILKSYNLDGLLNPKMKRLIVNASKQIETHLGPGTYHVSDDLIRKSPKVIIIQIINII
jgi:hypothetical protein